MGKPPVQWNCEGCSNSGLLAPPQEPVMVQEGEIEIPEVSEDGKLIYETIIEKDDNGKTVKVKKPKTTMKPRMVQARRTTLRQEPVTGKMHTIDVPAMRDLADRIYMVQLRVGEEIVTRYLCDECVGKLVPLLKPAKDKMLGMNQ